jgi:hypothetical protein
MLAWGSRNRRIGQHFQAPGLAAAAQSLGDSADNARHGVACQLKLDEAQLSIALNAGDELGGAVMAAAAGREGR